MHHDARDLLKRAAESFQTIAMQWDAEYDLALLQRALERSIPELPELLASGAIVRLRPQESKIGHRAQDQSYRHNWRLWWRKPSCWRDDVIWDNGAIAVNVICGDLASAYISPLRTVYTNLRPAELFARLRNTFTFRVKHRVPTLANRLQQVPLVDPSFLVDGWALTVLGERNHAGRKALSIRAIRLDEGVRPEVWDFVEEYHVLADLERGVLLRYAGIVAGREAGVFSVRSVCFDEPVTDEVFTYKPPAGTRILAR
jgi:hypothetical protein